MTDNAGRQSRRRRILQCATLVLAVGFAYVGSFAVVLSRGKGKANKPCMYFADVSTPEGWQEHRRRASFYAPMFWLFFEVFGTARPCGVPPEYGLKL